MDPKACFATLARYGAWATARLFDAVAQVADDDQRDVGLLFKTIHATLNNLLQPEQAKP